MVRMIGKTSKHSYDTTAKKEMKGIERRQVAQEASQALLERNSSTRCSKPAGEYCRIHNPAPRFSGMSPDQIFDSVLPPQDRASQVKKPYRAKEIITLTKELDETRKALWSKAEKLGISIPDIGYFVHKDNPDSELVALYVNEDYLISELDASMHYHSSKMHMYLTEMIHAEFTGDKKAQAIAQSAALARYGTPQDDYKPDSFENYRDLGITREEFFTEINKPIFSRKIRNIEKGYLTVVIGKEPPKGHLDRLAKLRKQFSQKEITAELTAKAAEENRKCFITAYDK